MPWDAAQVNRGRKRNARELLLTISEYRGGDHLLPRSKGRFPLPLCDCAGLPFTGVEESSSGGLNNV